MTASAYAPALGILRRAGLLAALLTLMAGIFGMHILTTTHAPHAPAAAASLDADHGASPAAHTANHAPDTLPGNATPADDAPTDSVPGDGMQTVQYAESGHCTSVHAMTGACTPSVKTGSLTAPLPGTAVIAWNTRARDLPATSARWSYLPGSPSPGELCISRT